MKRILTRLVALVSLIALTVGVCVGFSACNDDKTKSVADIFKSSVSLKEFTSFEQEFILPDGWSVYTNSRKSGDKASTSLSVNSDVGYIKDINAFVVQTREGHLSIVKCDDDRVYVDGEMKGLLFPSNIGISALRVKDGLIVVKFANGEAGAFDYNGKTVLSRTKIGSGDKEISQAVNIDNVIKILDSKLIAVNHLYDNSGVSGYTSIYRPTYATQGAGELVCRVENADNKLDYVLGFDNYYVSVVGNKEADCMYYIPSIANGEPKNLNGTVNGSVSDNNEDNYYSEITYIGNGRFLVHEDWTVDKDKEYDYYDGFEYYVFERHIYEPASDKLSEHTKNADKVFLTLGSNYYDSQKMGIDTSMYLNDGYIYACYGLTIINKVGFYDQFILDEDLNIVMSLTGNYGVTIKDQKKDEVGYFDLIMQSVDGYYYVPYMPSTVYIYDSNGNQVGDYAGRKVNVQRQELNNNVMIAQITDPEDSESVLYGAYNLRGEDLIPFEYTSLSAFRGSYTIGERYDENNKRVYDLIGIDGKVITTMSDGTTLPFSDMAFTSESGGKAKGIYRIGCYIYKVDTGDKHENGAAINVYGVKNFNPNVEKSIIMEATMSQGCMLYTAEGNPEDVFVFEKISVGASVTYAVYRLI